MKKSVISKFLLGSFLVPSLLTNNAHVKAGGDDCCLGPRGKLPSYYLKNVLLYLPNSDDRMRVSQTCKNGQTANLQVRMLDLAKYGQTNYPKKWKPKEQKAKEAEALKNELIKSVKVNPKIETIRLSYRQFSLLNEYSFSDEDTKNLKNVFANKIVKLDKFLYYDHELLVVLKGFKGKFGVNQIEVEHLECCVLYSLDNCYFEEINQLFRKVYNIHPPQRFKSDEIKEKEFPELLNCSSTLVEVEKEDGIIWKKLQNKDEKWVIYDMSCYKEGKTIAMLRNKDISIETLWFISPKDILNFINELNLLKNNNELHNIIFPRRIKLGFNSSDISLDEICALLEVFSNLTVPVNSPVIFLGNLDYNNKLFTDKMMFAKIKKVEISGLYIRDQKSVEQFIEDLKKAKELNMLDRFDFNIWLPNENDLTQEQKDEILQYLPGEQIHYLVKG